MDVSEVLADLLAEQQSLDDIVAALSPDQWQLPTPSPGWTVADQIGHLTYFDGTAALAIVDPDGFTEQMNALLGAGTTGRSADDITLGGYRAMAPDDLLAAWRANRDALAAAGASLDNDTRVAWYGPSMGAKSFLTARLMEAWAHGQDIVDAVGATRQPTDRLRHIAQLGFITRSWTYVNRGLDVPTTPVRVELTSPVRRDLGVRPRSGRRRSRDDRRPGARLLSRHHPAPPRRRHRARGHRRRRPRLDGEGPTVRRSTLRRPTSPNAHQPE